MSKKNDPCMTVTFHFTQQHVDNIKTALNKLSRRPGVMEALQRLLVEMTPRPAPKRRRPRRRRMRRTAKPTS
jgi:hypothetical protein